MAKVITQLKEKQADGTYGASLPLGARAEHILIEKNKTLKNYIDESKDALIMQAEKSGASVVVSMPAGTPLEVISDITPREKQDPSAQAIPYASCTLNQNQKTYTVDFKQDIYGGTYNWATGKLISTLGSDGVELIQPVEIQLDPREILAEAGENIFSSTTGNTTIRRYTNFLPTDIYKGSEEGVVKKSDISKNAEENALKYQKELAGATVVSGSSVTLNLNKDTSLHIISKIKTQMSPSVGDVEGKPIPWTSATLTQNNSKTYTIAFGEEVFGGTLDWQEGIITSTLDANGLFLPSAKIIKVSPVEVLATEGENTFSVNTGDITVKRRQKPVRAFDRVATVGATGDFKTIGEALEYLSSFAPVYRNNKEAKYEVKILANTVITEQIAVRGRDLSYITITAEDPVVSVDSTNWTDNGFVDIEYQGKNPFFAGASSARLPTIGALFTSLNRTSDLGVLVSFNSEVAILPDCGFNNFSIGGIATYGSVISTRKANFESAYYYGVRITKGGNLFAPESSFRHTTKVAVSLDSGGTASISYANVGDSYIGLSAQNGSRVDANHLFGTDNPDTSSTDGYINAETGSTVNVRRISINSVQDGTTVLKVSKGGIIAAPDRKVPATDEVTGTKETNQPVNTLTADGIIFG